jgi:hypothetical protein
MQNVEQRKKELLKEYQVQLNSDNPVEQIMANNKIEKELMGIVRENLKSDSGYDLYASGDGNLDNNYKTINVMRGAVFNNITHTYSIVDSSLMNGIKKKDIPAFANSVVAAAYPSAIGTAESGYLSKILIALLQSESINPDPESDCGTESTIPITVTKGNKQYLLFRYIKEGKGKKLTTLHNIDSYIGKTIHMYSPQCCCQDPICGKCAGRVFYNLGVTKIGLLSSQITQKMLNIKLKSKHDLSQNAGIVPHEMTFLHPSKLYEITPDGYLKTNANMKMFIPKMTEDFNNYIREASNIQTLGVMPVKFYDKNDKETCSTLMTVPALLSFNLYAEVQEEPENLIITYEPNSAITKLAIRQTIVNVEYFINQIFLFSKVAQIPYNLIVQMMFNCLKMNKINLDSPSIIYEMLVRRTCRTEDHDTFAKIYGKNPSVDPLSYKKDNFRSLVQTSNFLSGLLFQDVSNSVKKGLCSTLNNRKQRETPLETIIKI